MDFKIDIPFGAHDSELKGWEYTIPEGMEAIIKDGKVIVREKKCKAMKAIESIIRVYGKIQGEWIDGYDMDTLVVHLRKAFAALEKQKEQSLRDFIDDFPYSDEQKEQKPAEVKDPFSNANFVRGYESGYADAKREQKPAEWSEEDENNLNKLLQWDGIPLGLRSWVSGLPEKVGTRPSWKPSEEQMEAFRSYIKDFQEKAEAAVGGWNNFDVMIRLFEQLKKL